MVEPRSPVPAAPNADLAPTGDIVQNGADTSAESLVKTGMRCETKDFYLLEEGDNVEWTDEYPHHIKEPVENDKTAQFAFIRRSIKDDDPRKKFLLHSIVIQSPLLKKVLGVVFKDYEGITTTLDRLEFEYPFEPFVHRWGKFNEVREAETDPETRRHFDLLWETLATELKKNLERRDDLLANGVMTYSLLWTIYEPRTLVYLKDGE